MFEVQLLETLQQQCHSYVSEINRLIDWIVENQIPQCKQLRETDKFVVSSDADR